MKLAKHYHIQPSEVERMPFWEYEVLLDAIKQDIKEENERNEKENGKYNNMSPNKMMSQAQKSMPKMPSMPSMPKIPH